MAMALVNRIAQSQLLVTESPAWRHKMAGLAVNKTYYPLGRLCQSGGISAGILHDPSLHFLTVLGLRSVQTRYG